MTARKNPPGVKNRRDVSQYIDTHTDFSLQNIGVLMEGSTEYRKMTRTTELMVFYIKSDGKEGKGYISNINNIQSMPS